MRRARIAVAVAMAFGLTFGLAGTAQAAATVEPDTLDFGQVVLGTTSERMAVTITNTGSEDTTVVGFPSGGEPGDLDGEPGGFEISDSTCAGNEGIDLPPGQSCSIGFVFTPTHTGEHSSVVIDWHEAGLGQIGSTTLSGAGVEPAPCTPPNGALSGPVHGLLGPLGLGDVSKLLCDLGL